MPATAALYGPQTPGVTMDAAYKGRLPGILEALKKPAGSDERAKALEHEASEWFESWRWHYRERIELAAHYNSLHWGYLDDKRLLWVGNTLDEDADRVRITVPITKACVDQAAAMMTQDDPRFRAAQGRPGVAAAAAGECARAFLDKAWDDHNLSDLYRDTAKSSFYLGTDFLLVEWDKTAGDADVVTRPDGSPVLERVPPEEATEAPGVPEEPGEAPEPAMPSGVGADGSLVMPTEPQFRPKIAPRGDLRYRRVPGEDVAYDPTSQRRGGQDGIGVIVRWRESRARLMEIAPDKFGQLPESASTNGDRPSASSEQRIARSSASGTPVGEKKDDGALTVLVFYLRARPGRPRGDCIMVCEGKILYEGENDIYPTEDERKRGELRPSENWPLFDFIADGRDGCPWGRARTLDVIGLQHAINGVYSKSVQHMALMANAQYVLPAGLDDEPTDEPGKAWRIPRQFWQMTNGEPVKILTPPVMPQYREEAADLIARFEYCVGVNAASMGQAPSTDPSGRAIGELQKRDDRRIAPLRRSHDRQWGRVQSYALRLIRRHATGERQLKVTGADGSVALRFFAVADLAPGTEVDVAADSLPRDMQARQLVMSNVTKDLAQLPTPELQQAYLESLGLPDMVDFLRRRSPHQNSAIDNNRLLLLGELPQPQPWDNALIHKAELERFLCSRDYKDRVAAEKKQAQGQGQSRLEMNAVWLWTYWSQHAMPAPSMGGMAPPAAPGAPAPASPAAPPAAQPLAMAA